MGRYIICALIVFILALSGCGADVDLILDNGQTSAMTDISDTGDEPDEAEDADAYSDVSAEEDTDGEPEIVCAYICGAVAVPGVYEAEAGVRLFALVEMAGGLTEGADESAVNLARTVKDGEMIYIPTEEETASGEVVPETAGGTAAASDAAGGTEYADGSLKININTASASELTALSGIGDSKAAAIVEYRETHGAFESIEDITNVSGIGDSTYDRIKDDITI